MKSSMSALPQLAQRDRFEDLAVVRERNFIAATPYVNRFGVLVMRKVELDSNAGTLIIEGSHKVPIPTAELLALAEGGLAGAEGSELVKHVPMDVGDTMFFMETLIHAAPEVRCKRLSQPPPRLLKVFAQLHLKNSSSAKSRSVFKQRALTTD